MKAIRGIRTRARAVLLPLTCGLIIGVTTVPLAAKTLGETGLDTVGAGVRASDKQLIANGIALMERAANAGDGETAFTLAVLYRGNISAEIPADGDKYCRWTTKSASLRFVDAYWGASSCALRNATSSTIVDAYENDVLPWMRRVESESRDPDDVRAARQVMALYREAIASTGPVTLGRLLSIIGAASSKVEPVATGRAKSLDPNSEVARPREFVCTIYCRSSSGPTIKHRVTARSGSVAASIANEQADAACLRAGHPAASKAELSKGQCK